MNVAFIGKHVYPKDIFSNEQDMKTWRSMAAYFDRLFVIVQSPNLFFHSGQEKNIRIYLIPRLGYAVFIKCAVVLGLYLKLRFGIDVFDASEVAGGGIAATFLKFLTGKSSVIEVQGEVFRKPHKPECSPIRMIRIYTRMARIKELLKHSCYSYALSYSYYYYKSLLLQKIGRITMKKADLIRVISHAIFNQVKEQGIPENKIRLVSLRVDLNLFNPQLWVSDTNKNMTIGYIGRLIDGKGLEDLLSAIANLRFQFQVSNFKLLIFGTGPLETKLREMAEDLKIDDKIDWCGFVPYSKVPEALAQIDIFVYPSWHEGFGRSIMEALAMEKAVVATRVGGIPDLIENGENGFLVEPHNPKELTEKVLILIKDKNLREKFGKAGRELVSKNFEWNRGIKQFANLFLELKQ